MRIDRCPWCGKKVDRRANRYQKQRTAPGSRMTRLERCRYCNNIYSQRISEKQMVLHLILFLSVICLPGLLSYKLAYYAVFPSVILSYIWIRYRPLKRLDENENPLSLDMPTLTATIVLHSSSDKKLKRNAQYFFADDFDRHDCFCAASPILVHAFNEKTGELSFSFLYEHPGNQVFLEHKNIVLYDSKMRKTAEIENTQSTNCYHQ